MATHVQVPYSTGPGRVVRCAAPRHDLGPRDIQGALDAEEYNCSNGPRDVQGALDVEKCNCSNGCCEEVIAKDFVSADESPLPKGSSSWVSTAVNAASATSAKISRASENLRSLFGMPSASEEKNSLESSQIASDEDVTKNHSVREKLNNAWLSFKYGNWKVKALPRYEKPLWLLGRFYFPPQNEDDHVAFEQDYYSRIWLTYRTELPAFPGTSKTTDCGWGCMLRTCQMMLAQSLTLLHLGREWRFCGDGEAARSKDGFDHYDIVGLFGDQLGCELGLHRLMQIAGESIKNPVGSWYTPSMALAIIRETLERTSSPVVGGLQLLCVADGLLVRSEALKVSEGFSRPLLIVVCVRLGARSINKRYYHHVLTFLALRGAVGIVGGRPKHSLYFIGSYNNKSLIYLDPHTAQPAIPAESLRSCWQRFHCGDVSKMPLEDVDPSCAFGLLVRSEKEYDSTVRDLSRSDLIDVDAGAEGQWRTADPIFSAVVDRPARFEGTRESHNAFLVAKAEEHGFELL